ncbi:hypothetical protein FA13DRAFT_1080354 [Coprinellus micaceus]|uniref:Uncharacterized protein n=1 Tax=Coprinellus micaceus TaxID=71717 RepID=A0A4Y7TT42_COPMI|nr:hypothetical protein FA13DRAFT_1080354 [Coprinellus micaceus]
MRHADPGSSSGTFIPGSRVFFWTDRGQIAYGTTKSTSVSTGTHLLHIETDDGRNLSLPAAGVLPV